MKTRQWIISAVIGVGLVGLGFVISGIIKSSKEEPKKRQAPPALKLVQVKEARYADQATNVVAFGRVMSAQPITVTAEVQGRLVRSGIQLRPAVRFRKGALLFAIDDEEARLNILGQRSQFLQQVANMLPDLQLDFPDRYEAWKAFYDAIQVDKALPALPDFKSPKEKAFIVTRGILNLYYTIKSAVERLEKYKYYAPYAGSVSEVYTEMGSVVNPGSQVVKILRTDRLEVELPVKVSEIEWIEPGKTVTLRSQDGQRSWKGQILRVGDFVDPETQSVNVYLSVQQRTGQKLYEGQYLQADLPGKLVEDVLEVPRKAVLKNQFMWVAVPSDSTAALQRRTIKIHKVNAETVLVSGIKKGSLYLINPPVSAREGMQVEIQRVEEAE